MMSGSCEKNQSRSIVNKSAPKCLCSQASRARELIGVLVDEPPNTRWVIVHKDVPFDGMSPDLQCAKTGAQARAQLNDRQRFLRYRILWEIPESREDSARVMVFDLLAVRVLHVQGLAIGQICTSPLVEFPSAWMIRVEVLVKQAGLDPGDLTRNGGTFGQRESSQDLDSPAGL
eukprot:scaffold81003_cov17-Prasinocladus_malaysianus.AAC.1